MCGIIGVKKNQFISDELIEKNKKRGGVSSVIFTTPVGKFMHFRAPTSGSNLHNLSEAYPLTYKGYGLIGNGVINEKYFRSIKDDTNENDLYYILKNIVKLGINTLENVEGCFALCLFKPDGQVLLVRNTFPLYYNEYIFSSVKFNDGNMLKNGIVYDWSNNIMLDLLDVKESPFWIEE